MQPPLVLLELCLQLLYLCSENGVFAVGRFRGLCEVFDLLLQVAEVFLLALTEGALRCPILCFTLGCGF